jgi:LmbE family N-acetylglucosaminyl deacetylase
MLALTFAAPPDRPLRVMCIGAHADDIEIGCAGTLLALAKRPGSIDIIWVVVSAGLASRRAEAHASAAALLPKVHRLTMIDGEFVDSQFPAQYVELKNFFERLKQHEAPDVIFTHHGHDRHQDHRVTHEMTWTTFRDHTILEYEVAKFDGDLGQPNVFVTLSEDEVAAKKAHLMGHFASQRSKDWFTADTFHGLMRLRGVECRSPSGFAEGFHARKLPLKVSL